MGNWWIPDFNSSSTSPSSTTPSSPGIAQNTSNEGTHLGSTRLDEDFPNEQILTSPNLTFTFAELETEIRNFWREREMGDSWTPHVDSSSTSSSSTRPSSLGIAQNTSNEGTHSGTGSAFSTRLDEDFPNGQIPTTPNSTFTCRIPHLDSSSTSPSKTRPSSPDGDGGAVSAATLGASSYSYGSWAQKKAIIILTPKLLQEPQHAVDVSIPDTPVYPGMVDGDPSSFDVDGGPDAGDGGFDANIDDPNTADNLRDFNQQDLKKAIRLYQKGHRIAIWESRPRVAGSDVPGVGPVEIRKYTVQETSQLRLFFIAVRTLSRTGIHANVARLLGISTRERSLMYKHFSDRTLHDSLHNSPSDRPSWDERLKIALGTARGLAFAHSKGLYHGNVKSSNILLDEKWNSKLVEFGVARLWSKNTWLNSSRGYVDQEYMNSGTNQLIAGMDVYSFGVVLVELLTGQNPSSKAFKRRGSSLAMVFISAVDEGRLQEVLDNIIWAEERNEQLRGVADLAKECLQQGGKGRPNMLTVRNVLSKWAPEGPGPQGRRPQNAAGSRPGVARNSNLQGQIENAQSEAQSALDVGQNITEDLE